MNESEMGQKHSTYVFLGEEYENGFPGRIRNSEKLVNKLRLAYQRFVDSKVIPKRELVGLIGLVWYMMHTVDLAVLFVMGLTHHFRNG